ncbi:volume-regulated anion channel subunit LRRC8C-like [Rhinophrynus dorsalis]
MIPISEFRQFSEQNPALRILKPWWDVISDYINILMLMVSVFAASLQKMLCVPMPPDPLLGALLVNFTTSNGIETHLFPSGYKTKLDLQYYLMINQWCYDNAVLAYSRFFPYLILANSMIFLISSNFWFKFPGTSSKIEHFISVLGKCLNSPWTIKALAEAVNEDVEMQTAEEDTSQTTTILSPRKKSVSEQEMHKSEPQASMQVTSEDPFEEAKELLTSKCPKKLVEMVVDKQFHGKKILDKKEGEQAKALFEKVKKFRLHTEEKDILYKFYKLQTILRMLEATAFLSYVAVYTQRMKHVVLCVEPLNVIGYTDFYCVHGLWRMYSMLSVGYLFALCIYTCMCLYTLYWIFFNKLKEYSFETMRKEAGIDDIPDVTNDFAFLLHLIDQYDKLYSWKFAVFLSDVSETKLLQVNLNQYWSQEKLKQGLSMNANRKTELRLCMLPGIPTQVFQLTEVEVLKLELITNATLISAISNLKLLKELCISNSIVKVEIQALAFLKKNLEILRVSFTNPNEIPSWMYNLSGLQELYLGGRLQLENKETIPLLSFKELNQLRFLSLKLYISKLPSVILDLAPTLKSLTIHNDSCKFSNHNSLKKFINLTHLRLIHCQLDCIPNSLYGLTLQELDLGSNNLTSLIELGNFQHLKALISLRLSKNIISTITSHIVKVSNLKSLYLNSNKLVTIFTGVFNLTKLCCLDLSKNNIHTVPPDIKKLVELEYFSVSHNNLTSLPDELFSCTKIQTLLLSHNKISVLSPLIGLLTHLHTLDLMEDPLEKLPAELDSCSCLQRNQLLVEKEIFQTLPLDVRERMMTI